MQVMSSNSTKALREAAFGVLCIGFTQEGDDLTRVPEDVAALIDEGVSGAILFKRNIQTPLQTAQLICSLKAQALRSERQLLLAVDQEGGRVQRLRGAPFADVPTMRRVGEANDEDVAYAVGRALADSVRLVGFDVDFAPVMDVDTNPQNPVIGDRSFGRDPHLVAELGVALAKGLEDGGVASCAKHFPGHGDTSQDSHLTLPKLSHDWARLNQVELLPFQAYASAKLASVMSAHVVFEAIDPFIPATFSHQIQTDLLRRQLGFRGLLVCDDLEMNAVSSRWSVPEAAVASIRAGVDWLLICHHPDLQRQAAEALIHAAEKDSSFRVRLLEAKILVDGFVRRWAHPFGASELVTLTAALSGDASGKDENLASWSASYPALGKLVNSSKSSGASSSLTEKFSDLAKDPTEAWRSKA